MFNKKKKQTEDEIVSALSEPAAESVWLTEYETEGQLAIDMYQTANELIIKAPIAGVKPEDIDITVENGMLTIKGQRKDEKEVQDDDYFARECYWGAFSRSVSLPVEVQEDKISADLSGDGILTISIPKLYKKEPRIIKIKPKAK